MERTPEVYSRGILAVALEPWLDGLSAVNGAYVANRDLRNNLDNPTLEIAAKLSLLDGVLPDDVPEELRNFLGVLLTNNDFGMVDAILQSLNRVLSEEAGGPLQAEVVSAVPLTNEERVKLEATLVERFGSALEFSYQVKPEILGGLVVQVGDKLIDDSVRSRLNALRQQIGA